MAKGINTMVVDLKASLIGVINEAHLPISVVCLVVNEMARQLMEQEKQVLRTEKEEELKENQIPKQEVIKNGDFKDTIG